MVDALEIEGCVVAPGEKKRSQLALMQLADGTSVSIPVLLINGAHSGPRVYLGAAIHGDEVNGIALFARALAQIDLQRLSGGIICAPSTLWRSTPITGCRYRSFSNLRSIRHRPTLGCAFREG